MFCVNTHTLPVNTHTTPAGELLAVLGVELIIVRQEAAGGHVPDAHDRHAHPTGDVDGDQLAIRIAGVVDETRRVRHLPGVDVPPRLESHDVEIGIVGVIACRKTSCRGGERVASRSEEEEGGQR